MAQVFQVERNKNFTVMNNHHFKNKNWSLKAKGLLSLMLSLPEDWNYLDNRSKMTQISQLLESGRIDHSESDRNSQFELNRNSQCTLAN